MFFTLPAMLLSVLILLQAYLLTAVLKRTLDFEADSQEPPLVPPKIPLLGHLIGLLRNGHTYIEHLSARSVHAIYTLKTFSTRIYVVNSPRLVLAVQRNAKNISFNPFVIAMMPRLFNVSQSDVRIAKADHGGEKGHWGYMAELHHAGISILGPGEESEHMVKAMLATMLESVDLLARPEDGRELELFAWLRRTITVASTDAVFGPENPFAKDPTLENAFWDFESQFTQLLLGIAPRFTALKGYAGRARIAKAMQAYFERDGQKRGSELVKSRYEAGKKFGLSMHAMASFQLGDCIGVLINSVPTTFWLLYHIFSSPELLQSIRAELDDAIILTQDPHGKQTFTVPVFELQDRRSLLLSTYKEVLRYRTHNSSSRYVLRDTLLDDLYLLKAHSIIQMPSAVIHTNADLWGPDAEDFDPRRFLKTAPPPPAPVSKKHTTTDQFSNGNSSTNTKNHRPTSSTSTPLSTTTSQSNPCPQPLSPSFRKVSFRAFGGGTTLCPGRHFATCTILAMVTLIILRFDIVPANTDPDPDPDDSKPEKKKWKEVKQAGGRLASTLPPPEGDLKVRIMPRRNASWEWGFEGGLRRFEV
ncbi:MAG: hypothetical protein Q9191_002754 [Dirinaria sp. TL-2023a]